MHTHVPRNPSTTLVQKQYLSGAQSRIFLPKKTLVWDKLSYHFIPRTPGSSGSSSKTCFFPIAGEPLPTVHWYMDDKLLDDTYQQTFEGVVKNDLTIRRLERVHTLSKLRCLASNNNLTRPVETSLNLKMLCKPQTRFFASVLNRTLDKI